MSMMFYLGYNNKVYLFSDTRVSTKIRGNHYYINDNAEKAKVFGDKIVFGMGRLEAINDIFDCLPSTGMQVQDVQRLAKEQFEKYNCDELVLYVLAVDHCRRYIVYTLASEDDFSISSDVIKNRDLGGSGANSDKALDYVYQHITSGKYNHHYSYIIDAYHYVADEIVGGKCIIFEVEAVDNYHININRHEHKIHDKKQLRRLSTQADPRGRAKFTKVNITDGNNTMLMDSETRKFYMNNWDIEGVGSLDAHFIQARTLTSEDGYINNLTVTALKTLDKSEEIGDTVDYVHVKDNFLKFITGTITDRQHAKNNNNQLLYWTDSSKTTLTTEATAYPFYDLTYNPVEKMNFFLEGEGLASYPKMILGTGDGVTSLSGKGIIEKPSGSLNVSYHRSSTGAVREVKLDDIGITIRANDDGTVSIEGKNINVSATNKITMSANEYEFA